MVGAEEGDKPPPEVGEGENGKTKLWMRNNYCNSMEDALELSKTDTGKYVMISWEEKETKLQTQDTSEW